MEVLSVEIHFETEATPESVRAYQPDVLVLATGGEAKTLPIDGFDGAAEAIDVLRGRVSCGERAVIIGGGLTGCELAYQLAKAGKKVTVAEALPEILGAPGIQPPNRTALIDLMNYYGVDVRTGVSIQKITEGGVELECETLPADTVIRAVGYRPVVPENLAKAFEGIEVHIIGDAKKVGNLMSVVRDAYQVGYAL